MSSFRLEVHNLKKVFTRKILFENVAFTLSVGDSLAITGKNGSGKSTLVKILCGLLSSSGGTMQYTVEGRKIPLSELYPSVGLVSPYLNMYEEFSGEENLELFAKIRGMKVDKLYHESLLRRFSIFEHRKKEVRFYSSGMKQRLKYCAALLHKPVLLYLDEPTANLDEAGIRVVRDIMKEQTASSSLIFATNEAEDLAFAKNILDLNRL